MLSELQQTKLANQFRLLDADDDGAIEAEDFLATARRICDAFGVGVAAPEAERLHELYAELSAQIPGVGDGKVTFEEFRDRLGRGIPEGLVATIRPLAEAIVAVSDADGDGEMNPDEFRRLLRAWGVSAGDADIAFRHLDIDLSGHLSADELAEAIEEFYCSDSPDAPGNWLCGPVEPSGPRARLPYPDPSELPAETQQILEALPQLNIFRMLAHASSMFPPFMQMRKALMGDLELPGDLRELAILQVAHELDATYVWTQHVSVARLESTPRAKIVAVRSRRVDSPSLTDVEQACLTFVAEVLHHNRASDATFDRLRSHLSPRAIVELLIVVGCYTLVCRVATALELDANRPHADPVVGLANSGTH